MKGKKSGSKVALLQRGARVEPGSDEHLTRYADNEQRGGDRKGLLAVSRASACPSRFLSSVAEPGGLSNHCCSPVLLLRPWSWFCSGGSMPKSGRAGRMEAYSVPFRDNMGAEGHCPVAVSIALGKQQRVYRNWMEQQFGRGGRQCEQTRRRWGWQSGDGQAGEEASNETEGLITTLLFQALRPKAPERAAMRHGEAP